MVDVRPRPFVALGLALGLALGCERPAVVVGPAEPPEPVHPVAGVWLATRPGRMAVAGDTADVVYAIRFHLRPDSTYALDRRLEEAEPEGKHIRVGRITHESSGLWITTQDHTWLVLYEEEARNLTRDGTYKKTEDARTIELSLRFFGHKAEIQRRSFRRE